MKLYFAALSPFVRKARVAAMELGLDKKIELVTVASTPVAMNPELGKANPLGKLPTLVTEDGDLLFASAVIVEYLDALAGGGKIIPAMGPDRWRVKRTEALAAADAAERGRLAAQYRGATNMTDRIAALRLLIDIEGPERWEALGHFYGRFSDDALVVDKWLGLQAISALPDTLERVKALMASPAFSLKKPNKVRALIGTFASANPLRYHAADGSGYAFHADRILELDPINPQVAARLLAPLGRWQRMDEGRQALMKRELERILKASKLSRDVYEIASKSLG